MTTETTETSSRGPGRPCGFDRDEVLTKLAMLFWEKGYDETSYEDMHGRTGLSRSSLQNAFGNKQEIFAASLEAYRGMAAPPTMTLLNGEKGLDDLHAFIDRAHRNMADESIPAGCLVINTMTEACIAEPPILEQARAYRESLEEAFRAALARAAAKGEVRDSGINARAAMLFSAFTGMVTAVRAEDSADAAEEMIEGLHGTLDAWAAEAAAGS